MRLFASLLSLIALSSATETEWRRRNYGTTGHYGNQYGHGGYDNHDHGDHIYGYDSIKAEKYYQSGDGLASQQTV